MDQGHRTCLGSVLLLSVILLLACQAALAEAVIPTQFRTLFQNVVLKHEYEGNGGKPLARWEVPVRLSVQFGASVDARSRATDLKAVSKVVRTIAAATRHSVVVSDTASNFQVFVVSQAELNAIGPILQQSVGLSAYAARAIARMPSNTNCLVVALPQRDKTQGLYRAVAVVRAGLSDAGRESCFNEEIAQGMGLPDDCKERPTIFNDNGEFAQLTDMDLAVLRVAYDPRLKSGMSPDTVMTILDQILKAES